MFFQTLVNQNIFLSPKFFCTGIKKILISNLIATVEGVKAGPFGIIIIVTEICNQWEKGKILTGSPSALYNLTYKAITFRAFRGEVFDVVITNVTNVGFFCEAGFLQIFVSKQLIPFGYYYEQQSKSFLNSLNYQEKFTKDLVIRVRIVSVKNDYNITQALGSVNERNLGLKG